ncbi:UDP-2,3-diacylglucosamine diphosphatase [Thioclava sp. GXIMD4216]|uniref:UDP-2,3-diacylglucosamine diphosphatase n=1 Tax=Thioclava litoralis TaxID=3076557 RepID=A0ABZ1E3D2_9RHOB|nr:UDP-2,3-diacylglucosamine diphosphatase [Thioclava sp. FTW29]
MTESFAPPVRQRRVRTLFVSDLHLGAWGSQAGRFLEFLKKTDAETIYLVGDILDIWHGGTPFWSPAHDAVMDELRRRIRAGVRVVYLPGNHDAELRKRLGRRFQGMELVDELVHRAADGRQFLVLHGDQCDARLFRFHFMTRLGSRCDAGLRQVDAWARRVLLRSFHRLPERNLVEMMIAGTNMLMTAGNKFEARLIELARSRGVDGVICGHFHKPALRTIEGVVYANCGDWIDSHTAMIETEDGRLELLELRPAAQRKGRKLPQGAEVQA